MEEEIHANRRHSNKLARPILFARNNLEGEPVIRDRKVAPLKTTKQPPAQMVQLPVQSAAVKILGCLIPALASNLAPQPNSLLGHACEVQVSIFLTAYIIILKLIHNYNKNTK